MAEFYYRLGYTGIVITDHFFNANIGCDRNLDWEDKVSLDRFIELCWKNHLKGKLTVEDADISQFTRRNLTRRMASLFDSLLDTVRENFG